MFVVVVDLIIKEGFADRYEEAAKRQGSNSRTKEPGCLQFDVLRNPEDPRHFVLYEVYTDKATFYDVHRTTPHFAQYAETTGPWIESRNFRGMARVWPE